MYRSFDTKAWLIDRNHRASEGRRNMLTRDNSGTEKRQVKRSGHITEQAFQFWKSEGHLCLRFKLYARNVDPSAQAKEVTKG